MRALAIALLALGCVSSSSVVCDDGRVCPPGTICVEAMCVVATCGDGDLDRGEQCDDGDLGALDCTTFGYYGPEGLSCAATCLPDPTTCTAGICGDRVVDPQEACDLAAPTADCGDLGFDVGRLTCAASCALDVSACERIGWTQLTSGTDVDLLGVWGADARNVLAVGRGGTILRFDGAEWTALASGTTADLAGVSGISPTYAIAVGASGTILHWNGTSWTPMTSGTSVSLTAVFVVSATRAFAVGDTTVLQYDGTAWTPMTYPFVAGEELLAVWANPTDVFVGGQDSSNTGAMVRRFNGSAWSVVFSEVGGGAVRAIHGVASNDVYMTGTFGRTVHYTSGSNHNCGTTTCAVIAPSGRLFGLWMSSAQNVYAVGSDGEILHRVGSQWRDEDSHQLEELYAVFGVAADDIFAVGMNGRVVRYTGIQRIAEQVGGTQSAAAVVSDNEIYLAGRSGPIGLVMRFNGASWTQDYYGGTALAAIWSPGPNEAIAVSVTGAIRYRSTSWTASHSDSSLALAGVWGSALDDVFVVGARGASGVVLHFDGNQWMEQSIPAVGALTAVTGTSRTDVYAVGTAGVILKYDGVAWTIVRPAGAATLRAVWAGGDDVIAVGDELVHRRGQAWVATPAPTTMYGLAGRNAASVYAAGELGTLLRWNGAAWIRIETGTSRRQNTVGVSGRTVVLGGILGEVIRFDLGDRAGTQELACNDYWDNDLDGAENCADPDCAASLACTQGGLCRGATSVSCGRWPGTTHAGPSRFDLQACATGFTTGSERYVRFVPMVSGDVTARVAEAAPGVTVTVLGTNARACDIEQCIGTGQEVTFSATADEAYFLVIDAPDDADGSHVLELDCPL